MTGPVSWEEARRRARAIWEAAVAAVQPERLVREAFADPNAPLARAVAEAERILVVGAGKAGAAMSLGVEAALTDRLDRVEGVVNVPAETVRPLRRVKLHPARPAGVNHPTPDGVVGAERILQTVRSARPGDVVLCLISGGGSALLPAPVEGVSLEDKQAVTRLLHACGASIAEMNAVRKHLSRVKGGRLVENFAGDHWFSLVISDVVGNPLDVIASGPSAPDPTTFADALDVLRRHAILDQVPPAVRRHLERGLCGEVRETPKHVSDRVVHLILGDNARALAAARAHATTLGYRVVNLGAFLEGDTAALARTQAGIVRSIRADGEPAPPPVCLLSGGETTVTLPREHGKGGRNQEFVLAMLVWLGKENLHDVVVLGGGTDGEDGPTDAAGALGDGILLAHADSLRLSPADHLARHDAYTFFDAVDGLIRSGLTGTNVMDVRVILVH